MASPPEQPEENISPRQYMLAQLAEAMEADPYFELEFEDEFEDEDEDEEFEGLREDDDDELQRVSDAMDAFRANRLPSILFGFDHQRRYGSRSSREITQPVDDKPNEKGQLLMGSSDFGSSTEKSRKMSTQQLLLKRELGIYSSRGQMMAFNQAIARSHLPESKADFVINHDHHCYIGQFSVDGNFFYSCDQDMKVRMFDTSDPYDWKYYKTVDYIGGNWTITDAALSPDNKFLAYSSIASVVYLADTTPGRDDTLRLDFSRGSPPHSMQPRSGIMSVRFSNDGTELVAGAKDKCVYIYDITTGQSILRLRGHTDEVNAVCYGESSSPHIIYSGSDDTTVKVWDRRTVSDGRPVGVFTGHTEGITFVHSKGDGRYVLSNGKDQQMKLWDMRNMMSSTEFMSMPRKNLSTRFDYRTDSYPNIDPPIRHPHDKSIVSFKGHSVHRTLIRCYFSPAVSTGSRYVYSGSADGKVKIYNIDATLAQEIDVHKALRVLLRSTEDRDSSRRYSWWGGFLRDFTCVRDVSWHPTAPVFAATGFQGCGVGKGCVSVHSWKGADTDLEKDEKAKYKPRIYSTEMVELD